MRTETGKTWWSVRHEHIGVAPCTSDHPDPAIRRARTGYAVVSFEPGNPNYGTQDAVSTNGTVIHAEYPWEALAILDTELGRTQQ